MRFKIISVLFMGLPILTLAHGEDRPGPHGGAIRMPGAFHTEVLSSGKSAVKVFLLDMEWKNPSVRDSKVKATLIDKMGRAKLGTCTKASDHFRCLFPADANLEKIGKLEITASREKQLGAKVDYKTPFNR